MTFEDLQKANGLIKSTPIQGKEYAQVPERVKAFRSVFPEGMILTEMVSLENGVVIFKATVYSGEGKVLGTGHAYEKEGSSFINKTSYIENCVPLSTQILTREGWKYYYQLRIGEEVLSYNMRTGENEFCELKAVNVYQNRPVVQMASSRFAVRCTPQHKWVARTQYKPMDKIPTEELTNSWKIIQAVRQDVPTNDMGRKLGWLMCDCDIDYTKDGMASTGYISQSKYVDDVKELFGEGRAVKCYDGKWLTNYEWVVPAETVRTILGFFGMASYKDLSRAMLEADISDVAGCYKSMMLADGSASRFSSTYIELVEAVQIMCARLGIATTFITSRMCEKSTKPIYSLGIKSTDGAWFSELEVTNCPPQDVWCPTTENGTWFMRQNGFVTMTSNCETSAVGRALGMAGFGIDTSIASAEEVQTAILNQRVDAICADCGKEVTPVIKKDGTQWPVASMKSYSERKYGRCLCADCMKKEDKK